MPLLRVAVTVALLGLLPTLASADVAAPRGKEPQVPIERRTGRVPATITVSPTGAGSAPTHLVITVPREVLRQVMGAPATAGRLEDGDMNTPVAGAIPPGTRIRHIVGAVGLALALATLPFALRGRRPSVAVLIALLCGTGAVVVVRGELRGESAAGIAQIGGGTPRTVEFVIVPGGGPVRVEARYGR